MITATITKTRTIKIPVPVHIEHMELREPSQALNHLRCDGCKKPIGSARPIAMVYGCEIGKTCRGYRFCNACLPKVSDVTP